MKNSLVSFAVGFLFAIGLAISGMTNPQKVIGFLDVFGKWDPSLIFVMLGAIGVHFFSYKLAKKRSSPLFSANWHIPNKKDLTKDLILGSFLFGVGWGIGGFCPGPAFVRLATFEPKTILFIASLLFGMFLYNKVAKFI